MNLVIRAVSLAGVPLTQPIAGYFDFRGGTIGRSDTNTLALPDPERHISRLQAEVMYVADAFIIRNVSNANPILHNERRIAPSDSTALKDGDELQIGSYVLHVEYAVDNLTARTITSGRAAASAGAALADAAGVPQALAPASTGPGAPLGGNPFADLFGSPAAASPAAANATTPAAQAGTPPSPQPDDTDPLAEPRSAAPATPVAAQVPASFTRVDIDLLGSVGAGSAQASINTMFGLSKAPASGGDPFAAFLAKPSADAGASPAGAACGPSPGRSADPSLDPLAMFGRDASAPAQAAQAAQAAQPVQSAGDRTPEISSAFTPPRPLSDADRHRETMPAVLRMESNRPMANATAMRPMPELRRPARFTAPSRPSPAQAAQAPVAVVIPGAPLAPAAPVASPEELWAAFCAGAGVSVDLPEGLTPALMRSIGEVLRESVDGTHRLIAARAATKQEMRAETTTIHARDNNPLKFAPDSAAALEQLLQPPLRGFMPGPQAVADAMADLLAHAIGTMAGMRAALEGVLTRFAPDQLEAKLVGRSMLDSVLPMNRRARLWELYLQHYDGVRSDAQDDFHALFGKAFLQAYEQQLDRLHDTPRDGD